MFIAAVVSPFRFTFMGRDLKVVTVFATVTATACFCSLIPVNPVSSESKSESPGCIQRAGIRYTARTLKISINTVIRTLKTRAEANNLIPDLS